MDTPIVGIVAVRVSGDPIRVQGDVTYSLGGKVGEEIEGPTGLAGIGIKTMGGFIEIVSIDSDDVDIKKLQEARRETVTATLENRKTIVLNDASVVGRIEVNALTGNYTVRFVGPTAQEV